MATITQQSINSNPDGRTYEFRHVFPRGTRSSYMMAESDDEALRLADLLRNGVAVEVWDGPRLIGRTIGGPIPWHWPRVPVRFLMRPGKATCERQPGNDDGRDGLSYRDPPHKCDQACGAIVPLDTGGSPRSVPPAPSLASVKFAVTYCPSRLSETDCAPDVTVNTPLVVLPT